MNIYFRRCHICSNLNKAYNKRVDECTNCKAELTPFYHFNDFEIGLGISSKAIMVREEPGEDVKFAPLVGLSVFW